MTAKPTGAKPEAPEPPKAPEYAAGDYYLVKHPSVGGGWLISQIVADPAGNLLVEFPDGTRYQPASVEIGGKVSNEPEPIVDQPQDATVSPLIADYQAFRRVLVELNAQSRRMFQLPLPVLLTMVSRYATSTEAEGSGQMGSFDGIQLFVPDQATFDKWLENYLLEIQRRESGSPE